MEMYTLDPRCWKIFRVFGRSPLLRRCDRIEALVALVAIAVSLAAIPVAGLAGSVVYTARDRQYAQEALTRHVLVTTAVAAGQPEADQRLQTWVDSDGNPVPPPTPAHRAVIGAIAVGVAILLGTTVAMSVLLGATRWRVDRVRDAQWEREIRCLQSHN